MLEHWLLKTPTWSDLIHALKSPPVDYGNIADYIQTMLTS